MTIPLGLLLDREASWRQDKRFAARLRYAKLRQQACAEDVDYRSPRGLDRPCSKSSSRGIGSRPTKTWPSLARPASASHGSLQRLATRPAAIIARCSITASQSSSKISPWRAAMAVIRASCVRSTAPTFSFILDDWGLEPFDAPARHDILEILEERYGRRSTIVTSNSPRTAGIKSSTTQPTPMRSSTVSFTTPIGSNWLAKACDASGQVAKKSQMKA